MTKAKRRAAGDEFLESMIFATESQLPVKIDGGE